MEYYQRIKALREDHDLNQAQVAAQLGIDQSYYSKYYFCYNQHGRENFRGSRSSLEPLLLFSITENRYRDKGGGLTAPW